MYPRITALSLGLACATVLVQSARAQQSQSFEFKPGDRISILGNAFADRMQHHGWLETLIHAKHPQHQLVFRNLSAAGDEVATWHRSQDFGSRDEWLGWTATDVVFAFYGFNESFKGYEGLEKFKATLDKFLKDLARQNYGGKGAPRVVLFSPIATEKHQDGNYPPPEENNTNLQNYTNAMAEVAKANNVPFVDLFAKSQQLFAEAAKKGQSLTINGLHLSEEGDKVLAPVIFQALFGTQPPSGAELEKLRAAVNEKNFQWHQRYRTIDGFNIYGGRSRMAYAPKDRLGKEGEKIFNNEVMQRELQQRDVLAANRDQRIWALAQGKDLAAKDDNLPQAIPVATNKPGDKPDLSHSYLSGEEALSKIQVHPGCKVNLFADEKQFPELVNPVQMAWDTKGRVWVAAWTNYPSRTPTSKVGDKLLVFEDVNADGKADKCTTFLDDLNGPTGFTFYKDGVLVMQAPDLWFVRDTNGDGRGDWKERVLMGLDSADSHHTTNALNPDPGGAIYLSDGVFHRTQVETHRGPLRHSDGIIWRFEPRTGKFENYAPYGFANPHGKVFDRWGNDLISDATGNNTYFGPAFSGRLDSGKHSSLKQFWDRPSRPTPGTGMLSSRHFPDDWQGVFLNLNVISFQGIYRVKVSQDGSGLKGETIEPLVSADPKEHPTFRPVAVSNGPDGAIYFADWSQTIIGHLQHHLRDPNRDHQHGRIYRITYEGRPLLTPAKIAGEPIEKLLDLLKEPEDGTRERAKIELSGRDSNQVIAAVDKWAAALDRNHPDYEHHMMEALWVHQWHNVVDEALLKNRLRSPEPRARAAATRVLSYWRDRVKDPVELLKVQAVDEDPRVRLHAVRAASFFDDAKAGAEIVYAAIARETDYYLDYTIGETLRQLRSMNKELPLPTDAKALTYLLEKMSDAELAKAPKIEPVLVAQLERKGMNPGVRDTALNELAKSHKTDRVTEIVAALDRIDSTGTSNTAADELGKMLVLASSSELTKSRAALSQLASKAQQAPVRRAAYAALLSADGKPDTVWGEAKDRAALIDAVGFVVDPGLRAKFQPLLTSALANAGTPGSIRTAAIRALPLMGAQNALSNFGVLAAALREGKDRAVAARAVMQLPRDTWAKEQAGAISEAILAWAKTVPAGDRTKQDYVETVQAGMELATLLPQVDAVRIRKELRALGVSVFVVKSVHEQMRFDTAQLVVEAGKPFEIIFENVDVMPHNLVVVQPGSREEVGTQAQTMPPTKLDRQGRAYVPDNKKIIAASKVLEPGQKETLKIDAPKQPGEYEYVCTFPGHWMVMWGKLIVTKDVDAVLTTVAPQGSAPTAAAHAHHNH